MRRGIPCRRSGARYRAVFRNTSTSLSAAMFAAYRQAEWRTAWRPLPQAVGSVTIPRHPLSRQYFTAYNQHTCAQFSWHEQDQQAGDPAAFSGSARNNNSRIAEPPLSGLRAFPHVKSQKFRVPGVKKNF